MEKAAHSENLLVRTNAIAALRVVQNTKAQAILKHKIMTNSG